MKLILIKFRKIKHIRSGYKSWRLVFNFEKKAINSMKCMKE